MRALEMKRLILSIQRTNFDCAVGACLSASALLGFKFSYEDIYKDLNPLPKTGTNHNKLERWCRSNLGAKEAGECVYDGGAAILNITVSKVGHYVLALGKKNTKIRFWCSWTGLVVEAEESELKWVNGSNTTKKWAVNLSENDYFEESESFVPGELTIYNKGLTKYLLEYKSYEEMLFGLEDQTLQNSRLKGA